MVFGRKPKEEHPPEPALGETEVHVSGPEAELRDDFGLYHLWYLERRLREELARAARVNSIFSLVCWRLRLLPGESPSRELLLKAASIIAGRVRQYDIFARIDEERFVAILYDAEYDSASTVAFRIKSDLQVASQSAGRWQAGIATFPRDGVDGDSLIQAAFRRLEEDARAA